MATQTIDKWTHETKIKRATRAYPYKQAEEKQITKQTNNNNKSKYTKKVRRVKKRASK